jgi:cytochrome P450
MKQVTESSPACPVSGGGQLAARVARTGVVHQVDRYADVVEVLRNASLLALLHDGTEQFRGGTVRQIDGPVHKQRRRVMGTLLRGKGDDWFRDNVLLPTIRRNLDAVLAQRDENGVARTDLVVFVRRAFFQLAASLIGLQGVEDLDFAENLRLLCEPINMAMRSWYTDAPDRDAIMTRGLQAKERFREMHFDPAYEYHEKLLREVEQGIRDSMPHDLLSIIVRGDDPELAADRGLALREALTDMINAGTFSSAFTFLHALTELLAWFGAHPEDLPLATDPEFLYGAVAEALRLNPVVPSLWRLAETDVTLATGANFRRGDVLEISVRPANRDPEQFGPNAGEFDPRRPATPGINTYGLTFGTGRHMCFGLPLIVGSTGANGSHVQMLRALFEAGVSLDPDDPPAATDGELAIWSRYPAVFSGRRG